MTNSRIGVTKEEDKKRERLLKALCSTNQKKFAKKKMTTISSNTFTLCIKSLDCVASRKIYGTPNTTICGVVSEPQTSNYCEDRRSTEEDYIKGIPKSISIMHCQSCAAYSFSPTTDFDFICAPLHSTLMLRYLLKRVLMNLNKLQLDLIDTYIMPSKHDSDKFKVALVVNQKSVDGMKLMKRHIIEYNVNQKTCCCCSYRSDKPVSQGAYTVTLRRCPSDRQNISGILHTILGHRSLGVRQIYKVALNEVNFVFETVNDATTFYDLLCSRLPIRTDKIPGDGAYKNVLLCPLAPEDLVYVRSNKVMDRLGSSGILMICTKVTNSISLCDPRTLTETTIGADEYWNDPTLFETYKDKWDFVEYVVLDVQVISKGNDTLADMIVARVADYGKNDKVFKTRTHLGNSLKPRDRAYGYDLCDVNNGYVKMAPNRESFQDVVLIRLSFHPTPSSCRRRKTNTECEEFLRALKKIPETMFNLSLGSHNQQPEIASEKPGESSTDYDLDVLLADLALNDYQDGKDCMTA